MSTMIYASLVLMVVTLFIWWSFEQYPHFKKLPMISIITSFVIIIGVILVTYGSPRSPELDVTYSLMVVLLLVTAFFFRKIMLFPTFSHKDDFYIFLEDGELKLLSKTKSKFPTNLTEFIVCTDSYYEALVNFHLQMGVSGTKEVDLRGIELGVSRNIKFPNLEPLIATPKKIACLFGKKYIEFSFPRLRTRGFLRV